MMVYSPAEDSYLMKRWLEQQELEGKKFLDMGTGSGILAVKAAEEGAEATAVDINPEALEKARERAVENGVAEDVELIDSDLFEQIEQNYDLIVFNPPYLPGDEGFSHEEERIGEEEIWRGGEKGTELTERFLEEAENYISESGKVAVILSSRSDYRETVERFDLEIVKKKQLWFETLFVAVSK